MEQPSRILIVAVPGLPEIRTGDDLAGMLATALAENQIALATGDILVLAHKIISKAEGRIVRLDDVQPSRRAHDLAARLGKDPRKIEVILSESAAVLRAVRPTDRPEGVLITRHKLGFVCANAAVDESNVGVEDSVVTLPADPDASARRLRARLEDLTGIRLGIVITDTFGRAWRLGHVNVAVGLAGVPASVDLAGQPDAFGRTLRVTAPALADELAAAAGLLMAKDAMAPAIVVSGVAWQESDSSAADLLRPQHEDLFL